MIPSPYDIYYFHAVCETLNLSRASERLGVVQPTLSQALKRLETSIGKPLFIRSPSGLTLTRVGEEFHFKSKTLFADWERLTQSLNDLDHTPSGKFIIGCHTSVAMYSLHHFMRELMEFSQLEISLIHGLSREMTEMIISRKIDIGLVINPVRHNDLVLKNLCTDRVGFWRTKKTHEDVLICDESMGQVQSLLKKGPPFKRIIHSSSLEVIAELASTGTGLAILPEKVAVKFKGLLPARDYWFSDELYLAYRVDASKTAGFKAIIEAITKAKI
jgi:DNA-binding transcriptional LysR family regulator